MLFLMVILPLCLSVQGSDTLLAPGGDVPEYGIINRNENQQGICGLNNDTELRSKSKVRKIFDTTL